VQKELCVTTRPGIFSADLHQTGDYAQDLRVSSAHFTAYSSTLGQEPAFDTNLEAGAMKGSPGPGTTGFHSFHSRMRGRGQIPMRQCQAPWRRCRESMSAPTPKPDPLPHVVGEDREECFLKTFTPASEGSVIDTSSLSERAPAKVVTDAPRAADSTCSCIALPSEVQLLEAGPYKSSVSGYNYICGCIVKRRPRCADQRFHPNFLS